MTWGYIYEFIVSASPENRDAERIIWYFENKTVSCQKAFKVP